MSEPIIQAKQNLVLNGDFNRATTNWTKINLGVAVVGDSYLDDRINVLNLNFEGGVRQDFRAPKTPGANAQYTLKFLAEVLHTESGWLRLFKGNQLLHEIELKPDPARDLERDLAQLAAGQPLAFLPKEYELPLDETFAADDTLRIEISSPKNEPNDYYRKIRIAFVDLQLHLEPLQLKTMQLDQQSLGPDSTLYLCLGATAITAHRLTFTPEPENAWDGTDASLRINDNLQEAIIVSPGQDVDQPLTSSWGLDCPIVGDEDRYSFTLSLLNQYSAEPFTQAVSLGHHRLACGAKLDAAYYPILGQEVRLGLQVVSYYTDQALVGRTVNWSQAGLGLIGASLTNEQGWAYFDYQPDAAGDVVVVASFDSPYYADGQVTESFKVLVLAEDPWINVKAVINGEETDWDAQGYPNRGTDHVVQVRLPVDSPICGTQLSLHWNGDSHNELGVDVSPELRDWVPVGSDDLVWTLTCDDERDGRFELSLQCSMLLLPSPQKRMSLARNLVEIGEVHNANKFPIVDEEESVLLRVEVLHRTSLGKGDPVSSALVDWETPEAVVSTVTGNGGWASLLYTPKTAGPLLVTARIKAHPEADPLPQSFDVLAIQSSPWKDQVQILLDDVEVERNTLGVLCRRGRSHTLSVQPIAGSPWIGKSISLHWRGAAPAIGLVPSDLGVGKPLLAGGVQWTLVSQANTSLSRLFDLELRLESVDAVRELSGRLVSENLNEEMSLILDQISSGLNDQYFYPCLGASHRFNVAPNPLSPLVGLQASLTWSGTSAEELGATVRPALDAAQPLSDGGAHWTLDFSASEKSGRFALTLALPQLDHTAPAKTMVLDHNKVRITAWREATIDPVVGQDPAWLSVQVSSHFTGKAVGQVPVNWSAGHDGPREPTDDAGWSRFAFAPQAGDEHMVTALVSNFFDDTDDSHSITVQALANDPWDDLLIWFDGLPPQQWGQSTCFPRRGLPHTFNVTPSDKSPLEDHVLTLGMTGTGPAQLGIAFNPPALGVPKLFNPGGHRYNFSAGDEQNGSFALRFASTRLARMSPAQAMSLGPGSQVVKIAERSRVSQTLLWGEELLEQITVVSAITGRPMSGMIVTWRGADLGVVTSVTNFYGVAKMAFVPTTPGVQALTASVGGALHSDSLSLPFYLNEPRQINALVSVETSVYPGQEMHACATVVSALTGEPLSDVWVEWAFEDVAIAPSKTNSEGEAVATFKTPFVKLGRLEAVVKGGIVGWDVKSLMVPVDTPELQQFVVPGGDVVQVGEITLVYISVVSFVSRKPLEGIEVVWVRDGIEQALRTKTNSYGSTYENFTPRVAGGMTIEARILDPQGRPFDSKEFVFTVMERS